MSDDGMHDTSMEEELDYDHGEEILLGGAKKLVIVSFLASSVSPPFFVPGYLGVKMPGYLCRELTGPVVCTGFGEVGGMESISTGSILQ